MGRELARLGDKPEPGEKPALSAQFAKNSGFGALSGIAAALGAFISSVIVAHLLGVAQTGAVAFAQWVVMLTATVSDLGAAATVSRFLPELAGGGRAADAKNLAAALVRVPAASGAAALLGFVGYAAWLLAANGGSSEAALRWALIGTASALQTMSGVAIGYLRGVQRFDLGAGLTIASICVQIGCVALGSVLFGVNGAIAGYGAGALIPAACALGLFRWPGRLPPGFTRRLVRYALYACAAGVLSGFVWSRLELLFLQHFWGEEAVGLFAVALSLANLAAQGPMLLTGGLLPYFAQNFGSRNYAAIRDAYASGTRVLAFLILPLCCGIAALMPEALPLIYGSHFSAAAAPATVIVIGAGLGSIGFVGVHLLHGMDRTDFLFASAGFGAALSVIAGITVVANFGVMGAAWARLTTQAVLVAAGFWFIAWRLGCPPPLKDLARLCLAAIACAAAARAGLAAVPGPAGLLAGIIAGAIAYIAIVRLIRALPRGDIERLQALNRRLHPALQLPGRVILTMIAGAEARVTPIGRIAPKAGEN